MTTPVAFLARYGPPVAWMGVIAVLSGDLFAAERTGAWLLPLLERLLPTVDRAVPHGVHAVVRKLGHVVEYGILAALWRRALATGSPAPHAGWMAVLLAALYAILDEARQGLAPSRTPSAMDVAIDTAGAILAVACLEGESRLARFAVTLARGAAGALAVAGLGAAVLDWRLGLNAGDLAIAVVAAAAAAWGLGRLRTRRPRNGSSA
jgi:VanZ family protein